MSLQRDSTLKLSHTVGWKGMYLGSSSMVPPMAEYVQERWPTAQVATAVFLQAIISGWQGTWGLGVMVLS